MLTKDLLRVSRAGGGYQPRFAGREHRPLAARVIGTFQGHKGEPRHRLEEALSDLEADAPDFKLVRGFAALLEREAIFETVAPLDPARIRTAVFEASTAVTVTDERSRAQALEQAGDRLSLSPEAVEDGLFADLEDRQILTEIEVPWSPEELLVQYNLSLAQTALFDATTVRIRSSEPKALISAVKRNRLLYEIKREPAGRTMVITGPTSVVRATRRYGTSFARVLRTVVQAASWSLEATVDDRGTVRDLTLTDDDPVRVPDAPPVTEPSYDSAVEADFAGRFSALELEWSLHREPAPLETGSSVMIPDFAFEYEHADFTVFFEIMGFWTPEYVTKKLEQLEHVEAVELVVAVDESLGVEGAIEALDHRAIPYRETVRLKDVVDVLREYEAELVASSVERLPETLAPDEDVISLEELASSLGVSENALERGHVSFPEHTLVGRTLLRPAVLEALAQDLEAGDTLEQAESLLAAYGVSDSSAVLAHLGYRVEWEGLSGGVLRER